MKIWPKTLTFFLCNSILFTQSGIEAFAAINTHKSISRPAASCVVFQEQAVVASMTEFWAPIDRHARVMVRKMERRFVDAPKNEYPIMLQAPEVVADLHINKSSKQREARVTGVRFIQAATRVVPGIAWNLWSIMSAVAGFAINGQWKDWFEATLQRPVNIVAHMLWNIGPVSLTLPEQISQKEGCRNLLDYIVALRGDGDITSTQERLLASGSFTMQATSIDMHGASTSGIAFGTRGVTRYMVRLDIPAGTPITVTPELLIPADSGKGILLHLKAGEREWFFRVKGTRFYIEEAISRSALDMILYSEALQTESDLTHISTQILSRGPQRFTTRGEGPAGTRLLFGSALGKTLSTTFKIPPNSEMTVTPIAAVTGDLSHGLYFLASRGSDQWYFRLVPKKGTIEIITWPEGEKIEHYVRMLLDGSDLTRATQALTAIPPISMVTTKAGGGSNYSYLGFGTVNRKRVGEEIHVPAGTPVKVSFVPVLKDDLSAGVYVRIETVGAAAEEEQVFWYAFSRKGKGYLRTIDSPQAQNFFDYRDAVKAGKEDRKRETRALLENGPWTVVTRAVAEETRLSRIYFRNYGGKPFELRLDVPPGTSVVLTPQLLIPGDQDAGLYLEINAAGQLNRYLFDKPFKTQTKPIVQKRVSPLGTHRIVQYVNALIQGEDLTEATRELVLNGSFELPVGAGEKMQRTGLYSVYMGSARTSKGSIGITTMLKLSAAVPIKITPILRVPGDYSKGADLRLEADGQTWYLRFKKTPSFVEKMHLPFTDNLRDFYEASVSGNREGVAAAAQILVGNNPSEMTTRAEPDERAGYSDLYLCYTNQTSYDLSLRVPPGTPVQVIAHYLDPENPGDGLFFEATAGSYRFFFRFDAISRVARRVDLHGTEEAKWTPSGPEEEARIARVKERIFSIYPNILEQIPYDVPPVPARPARDSRPAAPKPIKPVVTPLAGDEMGLRKEDMKKWFTHGAVQDIETLRERLKAAAKDGEDDVMLGTIRFQLRRDPEETSSRAFLACKVSDLPALADLMGWKWNLRSVLEALGEPGGNEVMVGKHGFESVFRGSNWKTVRDFEALLNAQAPNDEETTLHGIRFRRRRIHVFVKWTFDKRDVPTLAKALSLAQQTDTSAQPGEIVVSPTSLQNYYVGGLVSAYERLSARINEAAKDKKEVEIEGVTFHWRWTQGGYYWAFDEKDVEKVARFMGFLLQNEVKTLLSPQPEDFVVIVENIEPMFIGAADEIAKAFRDRLDKEAQGRMEVTVEGITFQRRKTLPHYSWSFNKDDMDKVVAAFHLTLRSSEEGIQSIQAGEMTVSADTLHPHIYGDAQDIATWLKERIVEAAQGKLAAVIGGVTFTKRMNGTARSWVFVPEDLPKVIAYVQTKPKTPRPPRPPRMKAPTRFKVIKPRETPLVGGEAEDADESSPALRRAIHTGDPKWELPDFDEENDIPITQDGMKDNVVCSAQKLSNELNRKLDALAGDATEVVIHGITARRKMSYGWRIWTIQKDDFVTFAKAEKLTLRAHVADLPLFQPGQITISIDSLRHTFVGDGSFMQKQLLERIAKERQGEAMEVVIGEARLVMAYYKPVRGWVFDASQAPALAEVMGWTIYPPDGKIDSLGPEEISTSGLGLQDYFIGEAGELSLALRTKIKAAAGIHAKVEINGISFRMAYNDPRYTWSFNQKDVEAVATMMGWRLQSEKTRFPKVVKGQIPVQGRRLTPFFPTRPFELADELVALLEAAAGKEHEIILGGVRFWRALNRSQRVWVFDEKEVALVAQLTGRQFTTEGILERLQAGEIALTPHGLGRRFVGHWYELLQELSEKLASASVIDGVKTLEGIPFYRRFTGSRRVWAIQEEDVERVGRLMNWEPRSQLPEDVELHSLSLEDELTYWQAQSKIDFDLASPRMWRYLVARLSERIGVPVTQLALKDFRLPCPELSTEYRARSLAGLYESYSKNVAKRPEGGVKILERLLADIGLVGPQVYTESGTAQPTSWQRIERMAELLKVDRVYVDLDGVLIWPDGWVGTGEWLTMRYEQSPTTAYNELLAEEARMVKAGYMVPTDPEAVAVIQRLQSRGVEVIGLTTRANRWERRVRRILKSNGLDISMEYVSSQKSDAKLARITKLQGELGRQALYVDNDAASIEMIEASDLPDVKTALYDSGRPPHWKEPAFYLERAKVRLQEKQADTAQEDLINAFELSGQPGMSYVDRVSIFNAAAPLLNQLTTFAVDTSPAFRAFLKQGAGLLADREAANIKLNGDFQQFLGTFFGHFFPSNATSMVQYYNDGLIEVRRRRAGARESYYFVIDETNTFAYLEPILQRILHEKPKKVFVVDSGARPFLWAIQAFVQTMNLPIEVGLLPLSLKTKGDTLPSTRHWLALGREVAEGHLTLEAFEEGIREAVQAFASLFPLENSSILLVDDNMSGGDTIDTAQRALTDEGISDLGAGVIWAMRDGKVARSQVTQTFVVPGQSSWSPGRHPPVAVHTVWEDNLHMRGIRSRDAYNGNPIPPALTEQDPDYLSYLNFRERLVANLLAHLARYRANLDAAPTRAGPILNLDDEMIPDASAIPRLHEPPLPEFALTLGNQTLICRPVHTQEQLIDYISRPDARPIDALGDQLSYPDLTVYQVVDTNGRIVGVFEAVMGLTRRSQYHDKAVVIDYVDLDYASGVDPREFMDALVAAASAVAEQAGANWLLMPKLEWTVSGRPELTGTLQNQDPYRRAPVLRDFIAPEETFKETDLIRAYNRHPDSHRDAVSHLGNRLSALFAHERLLEIDERARYVYEQGLFDYTAGQQIDPIWARLLRHRFRSLSRSRFRVLWHRISPQQSAIVQPFQKRLEAIRPYLFEDYEMGMSAQMEETLRMGMAPGPYLETFLERIERRRQFFENPEAPIQPWQNRFISIRGDLGKWTLEDKLTYQALEFYSLKIDAEDEDRPRYPAGFFDGKNGAIRAGAILRHVVFDINRLHDLRGLSSGFFVKQDLEAIWERVYNRSLSQVAEVLYPGQYDWRDGELVPRPLTASDIIRWKRGEMPLAPGRSHKRKASIDAGRGSVSIEAMDDVFGVSINKEEVARLIAADRQIIIRSYDDPNHGVMLGVFLPEEGSEPLTSYAISPVYNEAYLANPFIMDLAALRQGTNIKVRPDGSSWRYAKRRVSITQRETQTVATVRFSLEAFGIKDMTFFVSADEINRIENKEEIFVAVVNDPNHGPIVQLFKEADFDPRNPQASKNPLATYAWVSGTESQWMPVDLATMDILAWASGRTDLKPMSRQRKMNTYKMGNLRQANVVLGERHTENKADFNYTADEIRRFDLEKQLIILELKNDPDYGLYVATYIERDGSQVLVGTNILIKGKNKRADLNQLSLVDYTLGRSGHDGHPIEPREYLHPDPVPKIGQFHWSSGEPILVMGLEQLVQNRETPYRPRFIPERNLQYGWVIKIHDEDSYALDHTRKPDMILVRHRQRAALVPLEDFSKTILTDEDRARFQEMAESVNLEGLLKNGAALGPLLYQYFRLKFPGYFSLGSLPIVIHDWLTRRGKTPSTQGSAGTKRSVIRPQTPVSAEIHPTTEQPLQSPIEILAGIRQRAVYNSMIEDQEATMTDLLKTAENHADEEWRQVNRRVYDYFRSILGLELPELKPAGRQMLKLFQLEGIRHLIAHPQAALWDDPGLGKTIQAIAAALHIPRRNPERANLVLSVVPASGVKVWRDEIAKWTRYPHDVIVMASGGMATLYVRPDDEKGTRMTLTEALARYENNPPQHSPFVLVTYDALKGSFYSLWSYLGDLVKEYPEIPAGLFGSFEEFSTQYQRYDADWSEMKIAAALEEKLRQYMSNEKLTTIRERLSHHIRAAYGTPEAIRHMNPDVLIIDEAHKLRNEETLQAQALQGLTAPHKMMLSGRPLLSRDRAKLFPLLNWIMPERFPDYEAFLKQYPDTLEGRMELWLAMQDFALRRRKREVLLPGELPPMTPHEQHIVMDPTDQATYQQMENDFRAWLDGEVVRTGHLPGMDHIFSRLTRLVQFTSGLRFQNGSWMFDEKNPKVIALDEIVKAKMDAGEKIVLFTQFVEVAEAFRRRYAHLGVAYLAGNVGMRTRDKTIERFQSDPSARVCVATYGTGGETITLTAANNVVLYDLEYDVPEQPKDRIERLGQTRDMHLYTLVMNDTIDTDLLMLHAQKQEVFKQLIEGFFPPAVLLQELAASLANTIGVAGENMTSPLREMLDAFLSRPDQNGGTIQLLKAA